MTALVNASTGIISATYYYDDAFGNIINSTGSISNSICYAGYQYDEKTGYYYLNARMYDPKIARFLQEDTVTGESDDPLSLNLYTYVKNNPLIYFDPTGHYGLLFSGILNQLAKNLDEIVGFSTDSGNDDQTNDTSAPEEEPPTQVTVGSVFGNLVSGFGEFFTNEYNQISAAVSKEAAEYKEDPWGKSWSNAWPYLIPGYGYYLVGKMGYDTIKGNVEMYSAAVDVISTGDLNKMARSYGNYLGYASQTLAFVLCWRGYCKVL